MTPTPIDPVAAYGALATVAAVTAALQASTVFAVYPMAEQLEARHRSADAGTQAYTDVKMDATTYRRRLMILTMPLVLINAVVLAAWGDLVFARAASDWVFMAPWGGVLIAWAFLTVIPLWLWKRVRFL